MRPRTLYDLLAPVYARVVPALLDRVVTRASQRIRAGGPTTVLEVGIGPGRLLSELAARKNARITGVDISSNMLHLARRRLERRKRDASLVQADGQALPFADGSFDGVVGVLYLGVLPPQQVEEALVEMTRVVAPGGRVVVASLHFRHGLVRRGWMTAYRLLPELVGKIRPIDLGEAYERAGLRLLREEEIPDFAGIRMATLVKVVA